MDSFDEISYEDAFQKQYSWIAGNPVTQPPENPKRRTNPFEEDLNNPTLVDSFDLTELSTRDDSFGTMSELSAFNTYVEKIPSKAAAAQDEEVASPKSSASVPVVKVDSDSKIKRSLSLTDKYTHQDRRPKVFGQNFENVKDFVKKRHEMKRSSSLRGNISLPEDQLNAFLTSMEKENVMDTSQRSNQNVTDTSQRSNQNVTDTSSGVQSSTADTVLFKKSLMYRSPSPTLVQQNFEREVPEKYYLLKREFKTAARKIVELKKANDAALKRRNEIQAELFRAHKEVSELEHASNASNSKQKELEIELRIAKQRVAHVEREAANAIGRSSKLECRVEKSEKERAKCQRELLETREKVKDLESALRDSQNQRVKESQEKQEALQQIGSAEVTEAERAKEVECMREMIVENEERNKDLHAYIDGVNQEKAKCLGQIEELTNANVELKADFKQIAERYEGTRKHAEQSNERIKSQQERFNSMIRSRVGFEQELKRMHEELARQKLEKERLLGELQTVSRASQRNGVLAETQRKEAEKLKREVSSLKEKLVYHDVYKRVYENRKLVKENIRFNEIERFNVLSTSKSERQPPDSSTNAERKSKSLTNNDDDTLASVSFSSSASKTKVTAGGNKSSTAEEDYSFPRYLAETGEQRNQSTAFSDLYKTNDDITNALY